MTPVHRTTACTLILFTLLACGCRSVPMTGRRQLLLMEESEEITLALQSYEEATGGEAASTNQQYIDMVNRVGQRIAAASNRSDYQWEFRVIASPEQNAFCLPGGKVAIYEGIMPVCANEAGLAVVMSHEVAHALARHGGERMSHKMTVNGVGTFFSKFMKDKEVRHRELAMQAYGLGAKYGVVLPYSRKHESEADHMGLLLMARAGYDPAEAPRFWQRFAAFKDGAATAEFLSTHPSDSRRESDLNELLPEASQLYAQAAAKYGLGEPINVTAIAQTPAPQVPPTQPPPQAPPAAAPALSAGWQQPQPAPYVNPASWPPGVGPPATGR